MWIDSWGGDTTAAAGIYNALKEHKGKVTVKIDGKAVSAASVIAMAGDVVQMSPVGVMMIHNPWTGVQGEAKDLRQVADVLDVIKETIVNAYQLKSKLSREEIAQMMDGETWMSAQTAKENGFVDEVLYADNAPEPGKTALNFTHLAIQNSASASMRRFISNMKPPKEEKKTMDLKELQTENPDLLKQVQDAAVTAERDRVSALDALDDAKNPAVHDIVVAAKAAGQTADDVQMYVDIAKKHAPAEEPPANNAQNFMKQALADNKKSGADGVGADGAGSTQNDAQEKQAAVDFMVGVMNKKNGRVVK